MPSLADLESTFFGEVEATRLGMMVREVAKQAPTAAEHMVNVGLMAMQVAYELGGSEEDVIATALGGMGHDVGKGMCVTARAVESDEEFTPEFRRTLTLSHTFDGAVMLSLFFAPSQRYASAARTAFDSALHHHGPFPDRPEPLPENKDRLTIVRIADLVEACQDTRRKHRARPLTEAETLEKVEQILGNGEVFGASVLDVATALCIIRPRVVTAGPVTRLGLKALPLAS